MMMIMYEYDLACNDCGLYVAGFMT